MRSLLLYCFLLPIFLPIQAYSQNNSYDVVVYGATPGGIAAAISTARLGGRVLLVEELHQVGGLMSGGLSHTDFRTLESLHGIYREYINRVENYYRTRYGPDSPQVRASFYGTQAEPHVVRLIFESWLKEYPNLVVSTRYRLADVEVARRNGQNPRVVGATFVPVGAGKKIETTAKVYIDGTYEGDLLAKAGCAYWLGRESRQTYGELFAGKLYYENGKFLLGSTGEGDSAIQAYNFRVCMTDSAPNRLPVPRPATYDRTLYQPLVEAMKKGVVTAVADQIVKFQYLPNRKADVNDRHFAGSMSLSRPGWSHGWPEATPEQRKQIFDRHLDYTLGLFYFIQNDPDVPESIRREASAWGLPKDEYTDNAYFTPSLYVREGRRLSGTFVFTEQHCQQAPGTLRGYLQPDAVAVGDYGLNSHGCAPPPAYHPAIRDGAYSMYYSNLPYQIPYGVMIPKAMDGLFVPVAVSSSHVGYSALRYEPTWMALGQAAGIAAMQSIRANKQPRQADVPAIQAELHRLGATTVYFSDATGQSPHFRALQWAGTKGLFHQVPAWGTVPYVDHFVSIRGQYTKPFPYHEAKADEPMTRELAHQWMKLVGVKDASLAERSPGMSRGQFVQLLFERSNPYTTPK